MKSCEAASQFLESKYKKHTNSKYISTMGHVSKVLLKKLMNIKEEENTIETLLVLMTKIILCVVVPVKNRGSTKIRVNPRYPRNHRRGVRSSMDLVLSTFDQTITRIRFRGTKLRRLGLGRLG